MFADVKDGCQSYYWCTAGGDYYRSCQSGLLFNNDMQACDWASNVKCSSSPIPEPSPEPKPSPSPEPSPSPSPEASPSPNPSPTPVPEGSNKYVAYFQSWSDPWKSDPADSALANLPPYVTHVIVSFLRPETSYDGGLTFQGTGLDFSSSPSVVKDSISLLKKRNPGVKVLIAVGGATYTNFKSLNAAAIRKFVDEFGFDGVDLDYEPSSADCKVSGDSITCSTDQEYIDSVRKLRAALPRPYILSNAPWSVGAYGLGDWANAQPSSIYTGVAINMLKQVGDQLDLLNVMSYDASNAYSPIEAFEAYSHYFKGDIAMGVEVANEAWGGHVITMTEVDEMANAILSSSRPTNGMMLWSLQKRADQGPTAEQMSQRICKLFDLPSCSCTLFNGC